MDEAGNNRTLWIILGVIAALVLVALVVVFTRGEPPKLAGTSPAGVVQRYSAAVIAGDESTAAGYLSTEARDRCSNLEHAATDNVRVVLISTTERADSADVKVSIVTSVESGPFGSAESEHEDVFDLVRAGGDWRIDTAPWQLTVCPNTKATK